MEPAKEVMRDKVEKVNFQALDLPIVSNLSAEPEKDIKKIRHLLVEQITGMVRWRESIANLYGNGVGEIIEIGTAKVLSGLNKRINKAIISQNMENINDIDKFLQDI